MSELLEGQPGQGMVIVLARMQDRHREGAQLPSRMPYGRDLDEVRTRAHHRHHARLHRRRLPRIPADQSLRIRLMTSYAPSAPQDALSSRINRSVSSRRWSSAWEATTTAAPWSIGSTRSSTRPQLSITTLRRRLRAPLRRRCRVGARSLVEIGAASGRPVRLGDASRSAPAPRSSKTSPTASCSGRTRASAVQLDVS